MEEVLHIIGRHTEGVTVEQIAQVVKLPRRTLQRRLARLVADGEIQAMGQGKQRRYQPGSAEAARDELSVSQSGQQVRSLVRRPLLHRTPIGYVASLLEEYRPNRNFYLDEKLRSRLQDV